MKKNSGRRVEILFENDDFNKLVISAGLAWREIVVLRAYGKYFKQIGLPYSQSYIEQTLVLLPQTTALPYF